MNDLLIELFTDTWLPSKFNISLAINNNTRALYNTHTKSLALVNSGLYDRYLRSNCEVTYSPDETDEDANLLFARGFLVSKRTDELDVIKHEYISKRFDKSYFGATIAPTMNCNLTCSYCFEATSRKKCLHPFNMTKHVADGVVAYLARSCSEKRGLTVKWFGGEPLLALDAIQYISDLIIPAFTKMDKDYSSVMVSNGTLLTEQVVKQLVDCHVKALQVTIDIPHSVKYKGTSWSVDHVIEKLAVAANDISVILRINIVHDNERHFDKIYNEILKHKLDKSLASIVYAEVDFERCEVTTTGRTFPGIARREFIDISNRERMKGLQLSLPINFDIFRPSYGCSATKESRVAIDEQGYLYKCDTDIGLPERSYGSITNPEIPIKLSNYLPWLSYDWFENEACKNCKALPLCAGGCPHKRLFGADLYKSESLCFWDVNGELEERIKEYIYLHRSAATGAFKEIVDLTARPAEI